MVEENNFKCNNININFNIIFLNNNNANDNNSLNNWNLNNPNKQKELKNLVSHENIPKNIIEPSSIEPYELYGIFNNSINHILKLKPFFSKFKGITLHKFRIRIFERRITKTRI